MAFITVTNDSFVPEFGLPEGEAEILQNVACIISCRRGTMPMSRDIGLSQDWIGMPINTAQILLISELAEALKTQEPRVRLIQAECGEGEDAASGVKISVEVEIVDGE